jgi:hypothetical protein
VLQVAASARITKTAHTDKASAAVDAPVPDPASAAVTDIDVTAVKPLEAAAATAAVPKAEPHSIYGDLVHDLGYKKVSL